MGNKQDKDAIALKDVSDEDAASDASDVSDEQASDEDVSDEDDASDASDVSDEDASDEDEYMSLDASDDDELQDVPDEDALKDVPSEDVLEDVVGLNDVPDNALDLVYAKLELKDIAACRGVCKSMRNFIDNPRFVRFWNRQQHGPETLIYVGSQNEKCQAVGDPRQGWHRHLKLENTGCMKLLCTTHALMCFLEGKRQLVVVNPLTGQARKLPLWGTETDGEMVSAGIHFDRYAGEYTVVGAMTDNYYTEQILCTAMYSSATGSWSQLESRRSSPFNSIYKSSPIVWFKGDFYWTIGAYKKQMILRLDESSNRWIHMKEATLLGKGYQGLCVVNHRLLLGDKWLVEVDDQNVHISKAHDPFPDVISYVVCCIGPQSRKTVFQMTSSDHDCCIPNEEDLFTIPYMNPPKYCSDSGPNFFEFSAGLGI